MLKRHFEVLFGLIFPVLAIHNYFSDRLLVLAFRFLVGFLLIVISGCQTTYLVPERVHVSTDLPTDSTSAATPALTPAPISPEILDAGNGSSMDSRGIDMNQDSLIPPIPPSINGSFIEEDCLVLLWTGTGSDIVTEYLVYSQNEDSEEWSLSASVSIENTNQGSFKVCIDDILLDTRCSKYGIRSRDIYGNLSLLSDIVTHGTCEDIEF